MKVSAADKATGKSNSVTIENERGRLSQEDIDRVSSSPFESATISMLTLICSVDDPRG